MLGTSGWNGEDNPCDRNFREAANSKQSFMNDKSSPSGLRFCPKKRKYEV